MTFEKNEQSNVNTASDSLSQKLIPNERNSQKDTTDNSQTENNETITKNTPELKSTTNHSPDKNTKEKKPENTVEKILETEEETFQSGTEELLSKDQSTDAEEDHRKWANKRPSFKRDRIDLHYDEKHWIIGALGRILGLKFAPLNIPLERRLQTFAVFQWMFTFLFVIISCFFIYLALFFTQYWWISVAYSTYLYADWGVQNRGGRRVNWMRRWKLWKYMSDFFPAKVVKTVDLDPTKNYIMGSHPHGILSCGAFVHFCTEGSNYKNEYPYLKPSLATLDVQFRVPFWRDYVMMTGVVSANKSSIKHVLTQNQKGNALCVVIGGAKESLDGRPGKAVLYLKNRKGFCKIALETGTHLVPMFSFGENEVYDQLPNPPGSKVRKLQNILQKVFGFAPCIFFGRGMFQYSFGIVPFRTPIYTVVGDAIPVDQVDKPTQEAIDALHQKYMNSLIDLYNNHRAQYAPDPTVDLEIV